MSRRKKVPHPLTNKTRDVWSAISMVEDLRAKKAERIEKEKVLTTRRKLMEKPIY